MNKLKIQFYSDNEKQRAILYARFNYLLLLKPIVVPSILLSSSYSIFIDIANRFIQYVFIYDISTFFVLWIREQIHEISWIIRIS